MWVLITVVALALGALHVLSRALAGGVPPDLASPYWWAIIGYGLTPAVLATLLRRARRLAWPLAAVYALALALLPLWLG